ncbi:MAG: hypothetical protein KDD61_08055 [Bdellovibrionales bacterium]|nr:hypothetical protein [Bdellovibrionales bacterium]
MLPLTLNRKFLLGLILSFWVIIGPLHLVGHHGGSAPSCELCLHLTQKSAIARSSVIQIDVPRIDAQQSRSAVDVFVSDIYLSQPFVRGPPQIS